jgi:hypothetical protein
VRASLAADAEMQAVLAARCDEISELYSGLTTLGLLTSGHMGVNSGHMGVTSGHMAAHAALTSGRVARVQPGAASRTAAGGGRGDMQRTAAAGVPCAHALWMMSTRGAVREVRVPRRSQVALDPS